MLMKEFERTENDLENKVVEAQKRFDNEQIKVCPQSEETRTDGPFLDRRVSREDGGEEEGHRESRRPNETNLRPLRRDGAEGEQILQLSPPCLEQENQTKETRRRRRDRR